MTVASGIKVLFSPGFVSGREKGEANVSDEHHEGHREPDRASERERLDNQTPTAFEASAQSVFVAASCSTAIPVVSAAAAATSAATSAASSAATAAY